MKDRISFKEWMDNYLEGKYESPDTKTMIEAGWYDWFCKDLSLKNRLERMIPMVIKIYRSKKIDINKTYIWFKNNCPMDGSLYDDFRIANIKTGDVIYTIIPKSGHESEKDHRSMVWGKENDFDGALVKGKLKDIYEFFGV